MTFWRLPKSAFEPASVPVRATPSQPSSVPKNGNADAGPGQAQAQDGVHAGVAGHERQPDHEADRQQRGRHPDDRPAEDRRDPARRQAEPERREQRRRRGPRCRAARGGSSRRSRPRASGSGRPAGPAAPPGAARASAASGPAKFRALTTAGWVARKMKHRGQQEGRPAPQDSGHRMVRQPPAAARLERGRGRGSPSAARP